jgi:hypothetical protein
VAILKMYSSLPESEPHFVCGVLKIWIVARQFPHSSDYWDGNWLDVVANCSDQGASVTARGAIIHLGEIESLRDELRRMSQILSGTAELPTIEPNLHLKLTCDHLGHIAGICNISPDHLVQSHTFHFEIDQSYLDRLIRQCEMILTEYPIKDPQQENAN